MSYNHHLATPTESQLYSYLTHAEVKPFFAVSWIITWFSHDIRDVEEVYLSAHTGLFVFSPHLLSYRHPS
jgi:hypothetical protein